MSLSWLLVASVAAALAEQVSLSGAQRNSISASSKPNIIFILADDLGYGDVGCFGQTKIRTPNIDRLALEGMRFTQHYAGNAVCAPSRCVLMTGRHPGHAAIRNNREVKPEGQPPIPGPALTIPKILKQHGYVTGAFGKWGLGFPGSEGDPLKQGFDRFYGFNCQRHAHNHFPAYLWDDDRRVLLGNPEFPAYQKLPANVEVNDAKTYERYAGNEYAPDLVTEQALRFIRANSGRPFFLYLPTTVPHLALQVPQDSLMEYVGKWPDEPYRGDRNYLPHHSPRAGYAAMITRLDRDIGRILALVESLGLDEKTMIVFTSDNGPVYGKLGGTDCDFFESAGRFRGRKGSLYEGGVRVPMVVRWKGRIRAGTVSHRVTGFEDWLPTLHEIVLANAKGKPRAAGPGESELQTNQVDGLSFAPTLFGKRQSPRPFLYREFPAYGGQQSVRLGDWKGVRQNLIPSNRAEPRLDIELYNLRKDAIEKEELSARYPRIVSQIERIMREQHAPSKEFPFPALDRLSP